MNVDEREPEIPAPGAPQAVPIPPEQAERAIALAWVQLAGNADTRDHLVTVLPPLSLRGS